MSLLWILSCQWSNVWVPSPVGAFLVVIFSIFVGRGCGPLHLTPVFSAISLISQASLSSWSMLELVSFIRAYCVIFLGPLRGGYLGLPSGAASSRLAAPVL